MAKGKATTATPTAPSAPGTPAKPTNPAKPSTPASPPPAPPAKKFATVEIKIFRDDNALTMEMAKEMLGWETEADYIAKMKAADPNLNEDAVKFKDNYFLTDRLGNKVRLHKNTRNRPWGEAVSEAYMQDILKKHWMLNGETIIIGEYGRVLSGQHRLIGLIFAEQERTKNESNTQHWEEFWQGPISINTIVVYGIEESSAVTRTLDNVKSRTLSDVIFADTDMFGTVKNAGDKKYLARMMDYAVKFLWTRAGEYKDAWTPKRTHAESLAFVDNHPHLKECIKHIFEENKDDRIAKVIYPGHAAALLYLMGHSGTAHDDIEDYYVNRPTTEKGLKWSNFKKAKMFWSDLARGADEFKELRLSRRPLPNDKDGFSGFVFLEAGDNGGSFDERVGMLVRAWEYYRKEEAIPALELMYERTETTEGLTLYALKENPTVTDSIDIGKKLPKPKKEKTEEASALDSLGDTDETPDEDEGDEEQTEEAAKQPAKPAPAVASLENIRKDWDTQKATYGENHILLYYSRNGSGNALLYFGDAEEVGPLIGSKAMLHPATGVTQIVIGPKEIDDVCAKVKEAGKNVLGMHFTDGKWVAKPHQTAEESFDVPEGETEVETTEGGEEAQITEVPAVAPAPTPVTQPGAARKTVTVKKKA